MEKAPFRCPTCNNWYAYLTLAPDDGCLQCAQGKHANLNEKNGSHCHYGQESATSSEMVLAGAYQEAKQARLALASMRQAGESPAGAEGLLAKLVSDARVADAVRDADVFVLPGREDGAWVNQFGLANLVRDNRRPPSDLDRVKRSASACQQLYTALNAEVALLGVELDAFKLEAQIREQANGREMVGTKAPATAGQPKSSVTRRRRAPKKAKPDPVAIGA